MILSFDTQGKLPQGIHWVTWTEIQEKLAFSEKRLWLLEKLYLALSNLKDAGCQTVYLDGSFVTTKERPGDIDVCYDPRNIDGKLLDPVFLEFSNRRAAQKAKYGSEFFPSSVVASLNPRLTYLEFFQLDKDTGESKGIIAIDLRRFP